MNSEQLAKRLIDLTSSIAYKKKKKEELENEIATIRSELAKTTEISEKKLTLESIRAYLDKEKKAIEKSSKEIEKETSDLEELVNV